ncbi:hypothetical protein HDU96_005868 [Phlyctochytrium bullatum]|nr:hypothetical protein HDU96_005868 [Phlyctochytrium bullatum]
MSDGSGTTSAGDIDLAAEGIISEGTVTTIYSASSSPRLPKRHAKVTLAERRMVLVGLHGSLVELIDTIFSGLISRHSTLRGHAALLLLFAFVTYAWKVGEILVPSQVKFMVERFTTTVSKTGTPVVGDGVAPNDYNGDKLNVLRVQAETTPLNLIKDIEGSPNFSSAFKTSFAAQARITFFAESYVRHGAYHLPPPFLCRGVIQTGRLSFTLSRTAATLTRFEVTSTVNQNHNVLAGYHAFRPMHETLATTQTSCGNTGTRCNGFPGLTSIGDTLGLAFAVEGAYIGAMMVPVAGKSRLASTTAGEYEPVSETQDRKFVGVNVYLLMVYVAVAGLPMLAALGFFLVSIAATAMSNKTALVLMRVWAYENWTGATEIDVDAAVRDRRLGNMDRDEVAKLAVTHPAGAGGLIKRGRLLNSY